MKGNTRNGMESFLFEYCVFMLSLICCWRFRCFLSRLLKVKEEYPAGKGFQNLKHHFHFFYTFLFPIFTFIITKLTLGGFRPWQVHHQSRSRMILVYSFPFFFHLFVGFIFLNILQNKPELISHVPEVHPIIIAGAYINLSLCIFQLIPVPPAGLGQVLMLFFPRIQNTEDTKVKLVFNCFLFGIIFSGLLGHLLSFSSTLPSLKIVLTGN